MFCLPNPTLIYLWEIFIFPGSVCLFWCRKYVDRSWEYINRSQIHECGNWDWGRAIPRKGIHKWDLLCSVAYPVALFFSQEIIYFKPLSRLAVYANIRNKDASIPAWFRQATQNIGYVWKVELGGMGCVYRHLPRGWRSEDYRVRQNV